MGIFDYIFYRLYVVYKKHDDPPTFSACFILYVFFIIFFVIFNAFLNNYIIDGYLTKQRGNEEESLIYYVGVSVIAFVGILCVYRKKRVERIIKKYRKFPLNKSIPMWLIWCSPIAVLLICLGGYQLLKLMFVR